MKIDIISVQPKMFSGFLTESIVARAVKKGACEIAITDLRDFGEGRWKKVDDKPYGGGPGMLMKCGPWFAAVEACLGKEVKVKGEGEQRNCKNSTVQPPTSNLQPSTRIIMTSPAGKVFTQRDAEMFASLAAPDPSSTSTSNLHLIFLCGHYEGFDARIDTLVTDKYSVGDFVMTGGELAAAAMTDAIVRLLPGVLGGGPAATSNESFSLHNPQPSLVRVASSSSRMESIRPFSNSNSLLPQPSTLLEAPQYTHPPEFRGMKVPEVLLSGDHAKIEAWRAAESRKLTAQARPDLL